MPLHLRPDPATDRVLRNTRDAASRRPRWADRRLRPRETVGAMMLGALASALGIVVLAVVLAGCGGASLGEWNEWRGIGVEGRPAKMILVPNPYCVSLAYLGIGLGGAGLAITLRRREISLVSALGVLLCLVAVMSGMLYEGITTILYFR